MVRTSSENISIGCLSGHLEIPGILLQSVGPMR